ncbi:hypothetical protein CcI49_21445 [Frankia sp. CcI49]|nr:hypothetical protein ACG83_26500 [Frankia sp. R43]ONH58522.1 hypothetical protein CcI49_21445 [Frankia sp. CcI49]
MVGARRRFGDQLGRIEARPPRARTARGLPDRSGPEVAEADQARSGLARAPHIHRLAGPVARTAGGAAAPGERVLALRDHARPLPVRGAALLQPHLRLHTMTNDAP